ncbi:MAG: D-alanyl-D-alanine carboxypeptidase [Alphaproteobacteria bacterium]|nr:D-alanyl-D-alanine carboxypeptidase [Alphaproteobacteria bacterium]
MTTPDPTILARRTLLGGLAAALVGGRRAFALNDDETGVIGRAGLDPGQVGFIVVDAVDGRVLSAHNPDVAFIPASVAKLPSILAAVAILGPQHRFRTRLVVEAAAPGRAGPPRLVLVGGGDPSLDGDRLTELARALAAQPQRRFAGFGYDESQLATLPRIVADQPEAAAFNPGVGALSLNFNRVFAAWRRNAEGVTSTSVTSIAARTRLPVDWIVVRPRAGDPNDVAYQRVGNREEWSFAPDPPAAAGLWLPVRNPGYSAAMAFRALAAQQGIRLPLPQRVNAGAEAREIAAVESEPLVGIARDVMRFSNNLATELIGLCASQALTGRALSLAASATALADWLKARTPQTDWTGFRLANHSGLSGASRATPRQLAAILLAAQRGAYQPADPAAILPAARGRTNGTNGEAEPEIDAKSGTMWFAGGLAGMANARGGRPVAFAAFAVDWPRRAALDALRGPRPLRPPEGAREWTLRTRALISDLARGWARG